MTLLNEDNLIQTSALVKLRGTKIPQLHLVLADELDLLRLDDWLELSDNFVIDVLPSRCMSRSKPLDVRGLNIQIECRDRYAVRLSFTGMYEEWSSSFCSWSYGYTEYGKWIFRTEQPVYPTGLCEYCRKVNTLQETLNFRCRDRGHGRLPAPEGVFHFCNDICKGKYLKSFCPCCGFVKNTEERICQYCRQRERLRSMTSCPVCSEKVDHIRNTLGYIADDKPPLCSSCHNSYYLYQRDKERFRLLKTAGFI